MPPTPEILYARSDVWIVEVLQEIKAKHLAEADCHVAIAGEIEVDLQGICNCGEPQASG